MKKAQGSLEYLLLLGGAVLVAVIVIGVLTSIGDSSEKNIDDIWNYFQKLIGNSNCEKIGNCPEDGNGPLGCENPEECGENLGTTEFNVDPEDFRVSFNYRPLSNNSSLLYQQAFEKKDFVRRSFNYELMNSDCFENCENSFKERLTNYVNKMQPENEFWKNTHKRMIFDFWGNPTWLQNTQGKPDPEKWKPVVREIAVQLKGAAIPVYYEVWNEPDLEEFWQGTTKEYLELYQVLATEIKSADSNAKVGGATTNQWDNPIRGSQTPINIELIRFSAQENIPLDFVSWHHYRLPEAIHENVAVYREEIENAGLTKQPELIITEWNGWSQTLRESYPQLMASVIASNYFEFAKAKLDGAIFYNWEDDHSIKDPNQRYYGVLTRQDEETIGFRETYYAAHALFNSIANKSSAVAAMNKNGLRIIIGKPKEGNCYIFLAWEGIFTTTDPGFYETKEYFYTFEYAEAITVNKSVSVKSSLNEAKEVQIEENKLTFRLEANEVLGTEVCLE